MNRRLCMIGLLAATACFAQSAANDVTISDDSPASESLTSTNDGALIISSTTKSEIFRAAKGAPTADVWIKPGTNGLQRVLGVLADERSGTLWACSSGSPGSAPTALKTFELKTGAPKGSYDLPGGTGLCNDIAIAPDGTVFATDTDGRRVLRLRKNATTMEEWVKDAKFNGLDGIAFADDRTIVVNNFFGGTLLRIPIGSDSAAGPVSEIKTSQPITRPDGMRSLRSNTLLLIEGGHLDRVTIDGDNAKIEVLKDGFNGVTAVTQTGKIAWVLGGKMNPNAAGPAKIYAVPFSGE
jgi:sugar lactone lactonase YvrE